MLQVVDAYALIGDISGLAEKIQSFFMQEVLSETHSVLKSILQEVCSYDKGVDPLMNQDAKENAKQRGDPHKEVTSS